MKPVIGAGVLLVVITLAGCASTPAAERVAQVRAMEAESATRLSSEGELLYSADPSKKSGYDYCGIASV